MIARLRAFLEKVYVLPDPEAEVRLAFAPVAGMCLEALPRHACALAIDHDGPHEAQDGTWWG